mgnify:CR=1 FL=1
MILNRLWNQLKYRTGDQKGVNGNLKSDSKTPERKSPDFTPNPSDGEYQYHEAQDSYQHSKYSHWKSEHTRGSTTQNINMRAHARQKMEEKPSQRKRFKNLEKKSLPELEQRG